jgi:hypothetical protein
VASVIATPIAHVETVPLARTSGVCPSAIVVRLATMPYEGGYTVDVRVDDPAVVSRAEIVAASPARVQMRTFAADRYQACIARGKRTDGDASYAFAFAQGTVDFVWTPGTGPNKTPPVLSEIGGAKGFESRPHLATDRLVGFCVPA